MIFLYGRELDEIVPPCESSVITSLSGGAKTPHQPHVVKADTTRAALVARKRDSKPGSIDRRRGGE
jgi:hypothetical protein